MMKCNERIFKLASKLAALIFMPVILVGFLVVLPFLFMVALATTSTCDEFSSEWRSVMDVIKGLIRLMWIF